MSVRLIVKPNPTESPFWNTTIDSIINIVNADNTPVSVKIYLPLLLKREPKLKSKINNVNARQFDMIPAHATNIVIKNTLTFDSVGD